MAQTFTKKQFTNNIIYTNLQIKIWSIILLICLGTSSFAQITPDFRARYTAGNNVLMSAYEHINTADNGTVIVGYVGGNYYASHPMIVKLDEVGRVIWSKQISPIQTSDHYIYSLCEMSDGSIVVAGNSNYNDAPDYATVFLYKFDCQGQPIWGKKMTLDSAMPKAGFYLQTYNICKGENDDIIISLQVNSNRNAVVARVNNTGNLVWSKTFTADVNHTVRCDAFYSDNKIIIAGYKADNSYQNNYEKDFFTMKLNYGTGAVELKKDYYGNEFLPGPTEWLSAAKTHFNAQLLSNKKLALYGFFNYANTNYYVYYLLLDKDLSFITSKTFASPVSPDMAGYTRTTVQPNGVINIVGFNPYDFTKTYWFSTDSLFNVKKDIYIPYNNLTYLDGEYTVAQKGSNQTSYVESYYQGPKDYFELSVLQDDDKQTKNCLGKDTSMRHLQGWNVYSTSWSWDNIQDNQLFLSPYSVQVADVALTTEYICNPSASVAPLATTIKIKGDTNMCTLPLAQTFVATANGRLNQINWFIDSSAYASISYPNDSSIYVIFKPLPGNTTANTVKIYVKSGSCNTLNDSMSVHLFLSNIKLPANSTICKDTIRLQPGGWFKAYKWQDGSTDSFYTVTKPGKYAVQLTTFCGTTISDTAVFTTISYGKTGNVTICKGDSVVLKTASNLANYQWTPNVYLTHLSDSVVNAFPPSDIVYYMAATTLQGCFYGDTTTVKVNTAGYINLGKDLFLCKDDTLTLNAGNGFLSYNWSTGTIAQTYLVATPGTYSVSAVSTNGCIASDTINVLLKECINKIYVPNAFTPNLDGKNDTFNALTSGLLDAFEFLIYDRYGKLVFRSIDINAAWDGKINGDQQKAGNYIWICNYKFRNEPNKQMNGSVLLIR